MGTAYSVMVPTAMVGLITVESVALAPAAPPPDTVTALTCGVVAFVMTFTVTVIAGYDAPPARGSARVQVVPAHVQPVPAMETRVKPAGIDSVTVTVPLVEPAAAAFDTVTV